jgi:hypothetical protein
MKKPLKSKSLPSEPARHPPVLDSKPEQSKTSVPMHERGKPNGRREHKDSR